MPGAGVQPRRRDISKAASCNRPPMRGMSSERICSTVPETLKKIVRALGLRKINQVVERPDSPSFRGMVAKIPHLLSLVD